LNNVWQGNRSAMAQAVEVSHSVLVKIAAGQQGPGRRLLQAIAGHPKVNPAWLFTGEGEPLVAPKSDVTEGWPLPVAYEPLPGPVEKHKDKLSDDTFLVAGRFYRPSRYWLRP